MINDFDGDSKFVKCVDGVDAFFVGTLNAGGRGRVKWMKSWWLALALLVVTTVLAGGCVRQFVCAVA